MNFLFAILVYIALFASYGQPQTPPVAAAIREGSAAAAAGFQPGDRVLRIDGREIGRFEDMIGYIAIRPGQPMRFDIDRAGRQLSSGRRLRASTCSATGSATRRGSASSGWRGRRVEVVSLPPHQVVGAAFVQTGETVKMMVTTLGQLVRGQRSLQEMGGPLKIAQFSGQQASLGWLDFVLFMALISINLGFINLLPIPLLDGGHLLFYTIEGVRRKPLRPEAQEWAFRSGSGGAAGADDLRYFQRFGLFWRLFRAWRVDRVTMIGQGGRRQGAWPAERAGPSTHKGGMRDGD